jgi:hypothetical protein
VRFTPSGVIEVQTGNWYTPLTGRFITEVTGYPVHLSKGSMFIQVDGGYYAIPGFGGVRIKDGKYRGGAIRLTREVKDLEKTRALRKRYRAAYTHMRALIALEGGEPAFTPVHAQLCNDITAQVPVRDRAKFDAWVRRLAWAYDIDHINRFWPAVYSKFNAIKRVRVPLGELP